ncbi:MAG: hypothetical protein MnENMB40S_28150 [Rhizobiaceae bacterium MnEN-MB40S]|nr:MAG: hypothetical protein MnENMB40S_28150 [Rhizobiaceae bacterium MnEN-MB40S]
MSTDGDGSYITFTQSGGSISGGSALTGSASGLLLSSGDDNSPVSYYLTGGTVAGGTSNLLGDAVGVGIYTDGSNSPITVETSTGTTVTGGEALVGFSDGMQLFTTGGSDITATINGNISAPNTTLGEGVAAGLFASASGGDGIVGLTIGETSTVSGSAAGVIGIAEGAGTSTVNVYGNVNQTSASAGYLPLLGTVGVPVGVAAITTGSGDATATTHAGSTVTQSGDLSLVGTGGVGVVAWADGTGNAFATANGNVTARGVGVAAVAAGGGDATALSTASINVTGTSSPALLGATVGLLAQANDGNASASLIGGNVGIVLGQEPDIGVAAVVGLGGTGDATVTVGDGAAQSSLVNANGVGLLGVNLGTGNVMISSETADPEGDMNIVNSDGVGVAGFALDGNVDITTGIVNSNLGGGGGLGGSGVLGIAVGGDATVTTEGKTSVADGGLIGAGALSIDGNATVTVNGVIDPPVIGAISAAFGAGTATTNVNALTQATGLGAGAIQIGGPTGDAIVTTSAAIQSDFMGIGALNVGGEGNIDIDVDGSVSGLTGANVGYNGIMAVSLFNEGNVNVDTTANGTIAADNDGIQVSKVFGPGSVLVNTSAAISAGDEGIEVLSLGNDGNISIITNTGSTIVAGDDGISSLRYFGDGDLYVSADDAIDAGDDGIESVSIDSEGDVNIATQNGGTAGDGSDGGTIVAADDGISVVKVLGGGDVNVYANADINAGDEAIGIFRTLSGGAGSTINVGVDGTSTLVSGQNGIEVFTPLALNDVNVTVGTGSEVLSDDGVAVSVGGFSLLGDNNVTVTSDGLLRGEGSLLEPVVFVGTDGTSTIRNTDNGVIVSDTGDWDDDAIISLAGSDIEVYNSGDVTGQMKLISFDSYAMIDNSGDWETSGINMIYGLNGDATLNNSGMIETDGLTLFSFASAGGDSIVNNSGEIYVNGLTSFGGPLFGIDDFNNSGLVSMVNGVSDYGLVTLPVYGSGIGDMTIVAGNYNGMGGALAVDAALGAVGSSSSDMLVITGDVDGSTEVYVNNVGGFGAYNPIGIPVVGVLSGNTDLGDFVLANGPIDTGLFTYDLFLDAPADPAQWTPGFAPDAKAWVLASYADSSAFMFAQTVSIAQNMWHTTADGYLDRSSDLREIYGSTGTGYSTANADFIEAAPPPAAPAVNNNDNGVWLRGIGQYAESEGSESFEAFPGQFVSFNTDYNETIWGIEGGVDHAFHLNNGSTLVLGLMGGYVTNSVEFSGVGDTATVDGGMAGVYATWVNGPGYIDALFKADFLTADFSVGGSPASSDILNLGGRIEGGYRFTNASGYYIEPVASLAYVNTSVDDLTVLGTGVQIEDGDSLRGKIGGRLGTTMIVGNGKLDPYINAYVGGEFLGDNSAVIAGLSLQDDISGVFGEVGAGFNWYNATNNWSVYGQANYIFADEYWAGNGTLGVRYSW